MGHRTRKHGAVAREAVRQALAFDTSPEARKQRKQLADDWQHRGGNTGTFHKPQNNGGHLSQDYRIKHVRSAV